MLPHPKWVTHPVGTLGLGVGARHDQLLDDFSKAAGRRNVQWCPVLRESVCECGYACVCEREGEINHPSPIFSTSYSKVLGVNVEFVLFAVVEEQRDDGLLAGAARLVQGRALPFVQLVDFHGGQQFSMKERGGGCVRG